MNLSELPIPFWVALVTAIGAGLWFWGQRRTGFGIPAMAVIGTVAIWYFGDALYNDYSLMKGQFTDDVLALSWWQVVWFMGAFSFFVPRIHLSMNRPLHGRESEILRFVAGREVENPAFQNMIDRFLGPLLTAWGLLMALALVRVDFDVPGLFLPWLGSKAEPWGRDRVGGGIDALLSLCQYIQIFLTASFGILAAVARRPSTRFIALFICFLTMPFYLFDRTRNTMLSTVLPGLLAWVFLGMRGRALARFAVLAAALLVIEGWFSFVMKTRGEGRSVAMAFAAEETEEEEEEEEEIKEKSKHRGLNMFEELAWMNTFIKSGDYTPNLGKRYFAELVNPIPRSLWPGKPLIGIDYAKARGFGGGKSSQAGVVASVSTGMIGQGVNNFGRLFGPLASALLMAAWVGLLAKQDLLSRGEPARLLLYGLGLVLTFNLGRDVTLLVLYPFLFGSLLYWWWNRYLRKRPVAPVFATAASAAATKSPLSELETERKPRRRRLRPIDFDDEDPEAGKSLRETAQETPPTTPVTPPPARPMTPPEELINDDQSSR
jgi:hypothetical protein